MSRDLERVVSFDLSSLGYALSRGFREVLAPFDLEPREFGLLRDLGAREGQSQQAIADRLQIPPSRVVAIVDGLEQRRLVTRRPAPGDRRVRALYLTEAGRALLADAGAHALAYEQRVTAPLSQRQRAQLLNLLDRIAAGAGLTLGGPHAAVGDDSA